MCSGELRRLRNLDFAHGAQSFSASDVGTRRVMVGTNVYASTATVAFVRGVKKKVPVKGKHYADSTSDVGLRDTSWPAEPRDFDRVRGSEYNHDSAMPWDLL